MIILYLLFFLLGSSIASFYQVIIYRRSIHESWIFGRSNCEYCGKELSINALIPFFHYFILKGKTNCCQKKLSIVSPIYECIGGIILCLIFYKVDFNGQMLFYSIFYMTLYFLVLQDMSDKSIYYIDLLVIFFIQFLNFNFFNKKIYLSSILFTFILYSLIYILAKGGFGLGDVYFGLLLSLNEKSIYQAYYIFLGGMILASIYGVYLIIRKGVSRKYKVPLSPFLWLGSFIHFLALY